MDADTLFPLENLAPAAQDAPRTAARVQWPVRDQIEMNPFALEELLAADHSARVVWAFVERQDLSALYARIQAVLDRPGRTPIAPELLLALWLQATLDAVGSARELDRLCKESLPYQWLCGGVSVNYHTLSDFRSEQVEFLDDLLTRNVAALLSEGLVQMERVAQDGMRVRAAAGAASYRRQPKLEQFLEQARAQVEALRKELEESPQAGTARQRAARQRAARERQERLARAVAKSAQLQQERPDKERAKVRVSTSDPEVPVMKMGDGGFRPAANVQLATETATQIITGVEVTARGTDRGEILPMARQHHERYGRYPTQILVDGGFARKDDIERISQPPLGCTVFAPVPKPKDAQRDPHQPLDNDTAAVAAWRCRMGSPEAQAIYKERAATAECVNAIARNRGLRQFRVRGLQKIRAVVLWYAVAHNLWRAHTLRTATA